MGYRNSKTLTLTIAIAFVDRYIRDAKRLFRNKEEVRDAVLTFLAAKQHPFEQVTVEINTLDDPLAAKEAST